MKQENKKLRYIMYCRKSKDAEDAQVQSIDDQKKELNKLVISKNLNVVKTFGESKTAKKPGRSDFNEMMDILESGQADGILCWKINRLARNPKDGGDIQWLLQQNIIKSILTPGREYLPTDNVLMMAVELGVANQFILDLSKDVKRGLDSKVDKGWRPGRATLGYLNDKYGEKGAKKILKDPERFDIVKKMWGLLLTGNYSVPQIVRKATDEWGLRTKQTKKYPSDKLSLSGGYRIFTNPFYYGYFYWKGELIKGQHEPMITPEDFDLAQKILGRKGRPRPKNKRLPFNGVVVCGECGGMITSEEKTKYIQSEKKIKKYIYHRCTRHKKDKPCYQKSIKHEDLANQIKSYLNQITIPEELLHVVLETLRDNNEIEEVERDKIIAKHRKNYDGCIQRINELINLYISPHNADRELLTEEEFKERKNKLVEEKKQIDTETQKVSEGVEQWIELTEKTFNFAAYSKYWFDQGDYERKTQILQALGQKFYLKDGKLDIELKKPYLQIKQALEREPLKNIVLEKAKTLEYAYKNRKSTIFNDAFSAISG